MGLLDSLKNALRSEAKQTINSTTRKAVNDLGKSVEKSVHHAMTCKSVKFTFNSLPKNVDELKALPESKLDTPFKTVALTLAALCNYANDAEATFEMLEFLNGPDDVNGRDRQFIADRLDCKTYKPFSFFQGATPKNNYTPNMPYTITVSDNEYSYSEEVWATMYVQSGGADSPGIVKLRKKPSTGQWFVNDIQCLTDIRIPVAEDKWA